MTATPVETGSPELPVTVIVGCQQHLVPGGSTIAEVLDKFRVSPLVTAVQLNQEFLRGEKLKTTVLKSGDLLECLVQCAGG